MRGSTLPQAAVTSRKARTAPKSSICSMASIGFTLNIEIIPRLSSVAEAVVVAKTYIQAQKVEGPSTDALKEGRLRAESHL